MSPPRRITSGWGIQMTWQDNSWIIWSRHCTNCLLSETSLRAAKNIHMYNEHLLSYERVVAIFFTNTKIKEINISTSRANVSERCEELTCILHIGCVAQCQKDRAALSKVCLTSSYIPFSHKKFSSTNIDEWHI